ncbi:hypothetical protein FQA47_001865 [Oryzias melastigma]|uniref:Uncharacterized protein n=1 Tax=Oryzias melastigma TaxID=30732 RepID=A0A834FH17_ORYME|nr:hypothetical protein FQA47_001865 [Oryzias melastigma]
MEREEEVGPPERDRCPTDPTSTPRTGMVLRRQDHLGSRGGRPRPPLYSPLMLRWLPLPDELMISPLAFPAGVFLGTELLFSQVSCRFPLNHTCEGGVSSPL